LLNLDWDQIVPHIFVIRVLDGSRDALAASLKEKGIETGFHYLPNHKLSLFATGDVYPHAEQASGQLLTIPLHAELTDAEQEQVVSAIKTFFRAN
jgi:dTDP-4-amino-4,6-dideoxygalactose transaminase